jgi:20S proteasome subunit beta 2
MHLPFTTMGSGSLAAMGILETKYKDDMNEQEAVDLVKDAIEAGIFHDLGSGSNVDIFIVRRTGCEKKENYRVYNKKVFSQSDTYTFPRGTTQVVKNSEFEYKWKHLQITDENVSMDIY